MSETESPPATTSEPSAVPSKGPGGASPVRVQRYKLWSFLLGIALIPAAALAVAAFLSARQPADEDAARAKAQQEAVQRLATVLGAQVDAFFQTSESYVQGLATLLAVN